MNIVQVLGIISVCHGELAEVMEDIFGVEEGELKLMLRGLSSVGAHPLRCIWLIFVRFKSLGSIPCQSTAKEYKNQLTIQSIWYFHSLRFSAFSFFTVTDRTSSVTSVHTTTWDCFNSLDV